MFELTVALRYLIPRKKSLSTAIVSLISVAVISLVVWLVLVFLSVTWGIERNWLHKLTSLHAPIRLSPTENYYQSYFYQSDALSASSSYTTKTIGEKAATEKSDPYSAQVDAELPRYLPSPERHPDGTLHDPVKETFSMLDEMHVPYQDYEISAALFRLTLGHPAHPNGTLLSQMSYLLSFQEKNPRFSSLILPPSVEDLDHLIKKASNDLPSILTNTVIDEISVNQLDPTILPENVDMIAFVNPAAPECIIPVDLNTPPPAGYQKGHLIRKGSHWTWKNDTGTVLHKPILRLQDKLLFSLTAAPTRLGICAVKGMLQGHPVHGTIPLASGTITKATSRIQYTSTPSIAPPWLIEVNGHPVLPSMPLKQPVLLPKSFRDLGARLGDEGSLNFAALGAATSQDQKIIVRVAGFYDPGLFSMTGRCLIVPSSITRTIHAASQTFSPDGTPTNGIFIWSDDESLIPRIEKHLQEKNLSSYWKVSTFKDFEFSKELFQQFRSDRTLFLLIAILILLVACCNIISLLILLVNDKRREIAILQAMGASWKSVAAIFGCCGFVMGALSSLIGTAAAILTLNHLDVVVRLLSFFQGHAAFQPAFFGQSLPNELSLGALLFILIVTPLLSLMAGLIPALRARRVHISSALRQE